MNKKDIEKAALRLTETISTGDADFAKWIKSNQRKVLDAIVSELSEAPSQNGKLANSESLRRFVASLPARVRAALKKSGYAKAAGDFVRRFDGAEQLQIDLHKAVNGLNVAKVTAPVKEAMVNLTLSNMLGQGLDNLYTTTLQNELMRHAVVGSSLRGMIDAMRDFIAGSPDAQNTRISNYALQISRDALGQYNGAVNQRIADQFDLNAVVYVGSVVEDTRAQCGRWLGRDFILLTELPDEIAWAFDSGSGMIPGTTEDNFIIFRGGYSCRHTAVPIRVNDAQIESGTLD